MSILATIAAGTAVAGGKSLMDLSNNLITGSVSRHWNKKDSAFYTRQQMEFNKKYNEWLIPYQLGQEYDYAERYARNSPSWDVSALRKAGLNPILAASGGFSGGHSPSSSSGSIGSVTRPDSGVDSVRSMDILTAANAFKQNELLDAQNESIRLDNELKADNLKTIKAENEVKRLKAKAEYNVLKPEFRGSEDGPGKRVEIYTDSEGFRALQKAIRDDFDLRSERYLRETMDAVFRYGTDVLKLLPIFRRKEILDTITKTTKTAPNGKKTIYETSTIHSPHK